MQPFKLSIVRVAYAHYRSSDWLLGSVPLGGRVRSVSRIVRNNWRVRQARPYGLLCSLGAIARLFSWVGVPAEIE